MCPVHNSSTVCKSWIQLFAVSIFALPNKSPPFRLSHFASDKLSNVYVLHFLDKQWLPEFVLLITVLNDRKKRCVSQRIFVGKQKTFTIFLGTIHCSHRESKLGFERLKKWVFAWKLKKFNFERKRVWPHTDSRSQRLVVQINQKNITGVENPSNSYIVCCFNTCMKKLSSTAWCIGYHVRCSRRRFHVRSAARAIWLTSVKDQNCIFEW